MVTKWNGGVLVNVDKWLRSIDQLGAWYKVLSFRPSIGEHFTNPLRLDQKPGCYLRDDKGIIRLVDWADAQSNNMNVIDAYRKAFGYSFKEALEAIENETIGKSFVPYATNKKEKYKSALYSYVPRKFNAIDKDYWSKRGISSANLNNDNVFALSNFTLGGTTFEALEQSYAMAFESNRFKIYQPFADKKIKWLGNMNREDFWYMDDYLSTVLVLTKGYKECRIIKNLHPDVSTAALNGEGYKYLPQKFEKILNRYDKTIVLYDNDEAGRKGSVFVAELLKEKGFDADAIFMEDAEEKDIDEMVVKKGLEHTKSFLINLI